jgi:hypothetical protein
MKKNALTPPMRFAPAGELRLYLVHEHQLDELAKGSPASVLLNFSLFFIAVSITAFGTLYTAPPTVDRVYYVFVIIALVTLIAGVVTGVLWHVQHKSASRLVVEIKAQMPPNPPIQQLPVREIEAEEPVEGVLRSSEETQDEEPD